MRRRKTEYSEKILAMPLKIEYNKRKKGCFLFAVSGKGANRPMQGERSGCRI